MWHMRAVGVVVEVATGNVLLILFFDRCWIPFVPLNPKPTLVGVADVACVR